MGTDHITRRTALRAAVAAGLGIAATSAFAKKTPVTPPATPPVTPPATPAAPAGGSGSKTPEPAPKEVEGLSDHLSHDEAHSKTLNVKLMEEHHHHHVLQGKHIHVTPIDLSHITDAKQVARGQAVAYIDTELAGDETGLPPGKYHIVTAKVGKEWHAYAVANGKIVVRLKRVGWKAKQVAGKKGRPATVERIEFQEKGWGWWSWWPWDRWGSNVISNDGGSLIGRGGAGIIGQSGSTFVGWGGYA